MQAFKRRMKKNLDKDEYRRQMKILNILSDSDNDDGPEEIDWKIKIYRDF